MFFFLSNYRINGRNSTRFRHARTAAELTTISDEAGGGQLLPGFICGRRAAPRDTLIRAAVWRLAGQPVAMVICRRREILCRDNACLIPPSNYAGSPTHPPTARPGLVAGGYARQPTNILAGLLQSIPQLCSSAQKSRQDQGCSGAGRGGGRLPRHLFRQGTRPPLFGLKFVQKLVHCCN